jgi:hypothetical protein
MKRLIVIAFAWSLPIAAQQSLWRNITSSPRRPIMAAKIALPPSQRQSIEMLLKKRPPARCEVEEPEWPSRLRYQSVSLSVRKPVVLVEAGEGCARGGQGSNGAMWLIRLGGRAPVLLAGPHHGFEGFLYSIEPRISKGYRDVILGWHISASESGVAYFRFDGSVYRCIGVATVRDTERGIPELVRR